MKKVVLGFLIIMGTGFTTDISAQGKIGVFDVDIMVQAMPGYRAVDSMLQIFTNDSLRMEYDFNLKEYNRLDSTYKSDSAKKAPGSVLNYIKDQRTQFATTIIYWQQYSQQRSDNKRQQLAGGLYEKVLGAYDKVLKGNNYLVVLKPGSYEIGSRVENVFEKVAKELKIPLPDQLRSGPAEQQAEQPGNRTPVNAAKPPVTKPGPKKQ
jgi:Skp family chaperone for outer membrane proteins